MNYLAASQLMIPVKPNKKMAKSETYLATPDEIVINKIYIIRGQKVMIDRDLAKLYGVETKQLKRQVNRNIERFPKDFMFEMNTKEFEDWRCQIGSSNSQDNFRTPFC